jgi:hypothetical protein
LGVGLVAKNKKYYKGEGGGFLQVQTMMSFKNLCLLVFVYAQKCLNYTLTNLLFGL